MTKLFSLLMVFAASVSLHADDCLCLATPDLARGGCSGYSTEIYDESPKGIRLEKVTYGDKVLIHNYGQGRNDIGLSWGSADWVASQISGDRPGPIAVIGSGITALTTANALLDKGFQVVLYSDSCPPKREFCNQIPAIWRPVHAPSAKQDSMYRDLNKNSFCRLSRIACSANPEYKGVELLPIYAVNPPAGYGDGLPDAESLKACFDSYTHCDVIRWTSFRIDPYPFLCSLYERAKEKGACFRGRNFNCLEDVLALHTKYIVNATGYESKELFKDNSLVGVHAQALNFKPQCDVQYVLEVYENNEPSFYVIPTPSRLVLGETTTVLGQKRNSHRNTRGSRCPGPEVEEVCPDQPDKVAGHALWEKANFFFSCF